ncbi:MAG: glycosylase [Chitinophagaceae bacterium]|nr:MAG: glycosylase [Chitinophagaceae bacterium]
MKHIKILLIGICCLMGMMSNARAQKQIREIIPEAVMKKIYEEIKTPYKYGLVMAPSSDSTTADCPSVFRMDDKWYMVYVVFNGRGYETWLAKSENLLDWQTMGRILSFSSDTARWDCNQVAGFISLQDYNWGKTYELQKYASRYWMSYLGGKLKGFEPLPLSIGIAYTKKNPSLVHEWKRLPKPVLTSANPGVRWWENTTLYKSNIIWDKKKTTGYPFVMYYNANGDSSGINRHIERIGMAVSNDMIHWRRFGANPVLDHHKGITGDPQIQKIGNIWVMFYFGAFWPHGKSDGAFNNFACSYDLVHWTDWTGSRLVYPSEPFDDRYAHKPWVIRYKGVVYHYYVAVNKKGQRGIAVATSKDLGKSKVRFVCLPID